MKSSIELIADLNTAAETWGAVLLIVGFPRMTRAVLSSFPERLQILENLLDQGGIPVGMIGIEIINDVEHFSYCVLEERVADEWADPYMQGFIHEMATSDPGDLVSDSIGIENFRIHNS